MLRSYLDPKLEPLQHVEEAFTALFMLEGWFTQLKEEDDKQREAERINKGEEKARVCSERGSKRQYEQEQRKERQKCKEEQKAEKERQKREADALKEAARKNKRRRKGQAIMASTAPAPAGAAVVAAPTLVAPAAALGTPAASRRRPTVAAQFITRTAAAGVSFNAWFLFGFVHTLIVNDLRRSIPFAPRQLTEQEAEKIFRAARAVLGGENFTFADFLRRCDYLMAHGILKAQHGGVDFLPRAREGVEVGREAGL